MEEREEAEKMETHKHLLKIQEAVNRLISHDLHHESPDSDSSAIKALLELRTASVSLPSSPPLQFSLSKHLSQLADSVEELHNSKPSRYGLISFLAHRIRSREVSRLAADIESELQVLIDIQIVHSLTKTLAAIRSSSAKSSPPRDEDKLLDEMSVLQERLSRGFDIDLQDLLLKSGIFAELEWVLCNPLFAKTLREKAAVSMKELVLFNKDVFVGSVLVGGSVEALVSMDSPSSLQVLSSLIKAIKSPLVDEMESCGGILKIIGYLWSDKLEMRVMAMDCAMEIGYFGRKEAVEAMIDGGLIERLVELQRCELEGDLIDMEKARNKSEYVYLKCKEMKRRPFASCVARFAVQLEVGEGLRQREKRAFKQVILNGVRETCVSDAECSTIIAEVLWGSSP